MVCLRDACTRRASYGSVRDGLDKPGVPVHCAVHKAPGEVDLMHRRCGAADCLKVPIFGSPTDGIRRWCNAHRSLDIHVDLMHRTCTQALCGAPSTYGVLGDKCPTYCEQHKVNDMVQITPETRRRLDSEWEEWFKLAVAHLASGAAVPNATDAPMASDARVKPLHVESWIARQQQLLRTGLLTGSKALNLARLLATAKTEGGGGGGRERMPQASSTLQLHHRVPPVTCLSLQSAVPGARTQWASPSSCGAENTWKGRWKGVGHLSSATVLEATTCSRLKCSDLALALAPLPTRMPKKRTSWKGGRSVGRQGARKSRRKLRELSRRVFANPHRRPLRAISPNPATSSAGWLTWMQTMVALACMQTMVAPISTIFQSSIKPQITRARPANWPRNRVHVTRALTGRQISCWRQRTISKQANSSRSIWGRSLHPVMPTRCSRMPRPCSVPSLQPCRHARFGRGHAFARAHKLAHLLALPRGGMFANHVDPVLLLIVSVGVRNRLHM